MANLVRVGAAQISPHFFDKERTLEKTCGYIEEGGDLGLDLLVFPETYFCGYPYWRGSVSVRRSTELTARMIHTAISLDGPEVAQMAQTAREANVNCVVGCNELSDRPGSLTIYNSLVVISRRGEILGRHRKIMPTHSERLYWGLGDASDICVFDLDIGRMGAAICYEHHMTLLRAALAIKGEEIHCALWPGWWRVDRHLGGKIGEAGATNCDLESAIRQHAIENGVFVVSSSWFLRGEDIPADLREEMKYNLAVGGSCIVNPSGLIIAGPVFGEETIVWAEIDLEDRELAKAYLDGIGHYARPDLLTLQIRDEAWTLTGPQKLGDALPGPLAAQQMLDALRASGTTAEELGRLLAARGEEQEAPPAVG
ncbi:MAG TPA: carbon-nitrogen hydrolase family protein [Anaerolineae bacterium]|nr:carbon-nitrogen hydrolase family protein [Anaerolineae bacterium]